MILKRNKVKQTTCLPADINDEVVALDIQEHRDSVSATIAMLVREALANRRIKKEKTA